MTSDEVRQLLINQGFTPETVDDYIHTTEREMCYPRTVWDDVYRVPGDIIADYRDYVAEQVHKMERKDSINAKFAKPDANGDSEQSS